MYSQTTLDCVFARHADVGFAPWSGRRAVHAARAAFSQQRTQALLKEMEHWSLTALREKLVETGAKVVRQVRYVAFQLAEVAVPRNLFREILRLIDGLRPRPPA